MKAEQFLRNGADVLTERGKEYDKPEGERSMGKCMRAFNAITGRDLTEAEGWLIQQLLKDCRQWQNPDRYHEDSAVDCVNYAALKAEALSEQRSIFGEMVEGLQEMAECREKNAGKPDWKDAPSWAMWLAYDEAWIWFEVKPSISDNGTLMPNGFSWDNTSIRESFGYSIHYMEPRPSKDEEWIRVLGDGSPFGSIPDYDFDVLHHDGSITYGIHRENAVLKSHDKQGYWLWDNPAGNSIVAYRRSKEPRP